MKESNLSQVFDIIKNGESDYQKKIVKNYISDLFQEAILNIQHNHDCPDFDALMLHISHGSGEYKTGSALSTQNLSASLNHSISFNVILNWSYNYEFDAYSNLKAEIINPKMNHIGIEYDLVEWLGVEVYQNIVNLANRMAVANWEL